MVVTFLLLLSNLSCDFFYHNSLIILSNLELFPFLIISPNKSLLVKYIIFISDK